jgi:hypothetical protein
MYGVVFTLSPAGIIAGTEHAALQAPRLQEMFIDGVEANLNIGIVVCVACCTTARSAAV